MNDEIEEKTTAEFQTWMPNLPGSGISWSAWSTPGELAVLDPLSSVRNYDFGDKSKRENDYLEYA